MALPPKLAGQRLQVGEPVRTASGVAPATHTLEVYLDYVCPFSAKLFKTLTTAVVPRVREGQGAGGKWAGRPLDIVFRQQIQPWHPSSTLVHEAALAVLRLAPASFWDFSAALFDKQTDFFDVSLVNEPRNQTYRRLADLAASAVPDLKADDVYALLAIADKPGPDGSLNSGNQVTVDVKLVTKMNRLIGIHVTPTVVFDGVVQDVSSSWGLDQWEEYLDKNLV